MNISLHVIIPYLREPENKTTYMIECKDKS